MSVPRRLATCQMVSPARASTSRPSSVNFTDLPAPLPVVIDLAFRRHQVPSGFDNSSGKYFSTHSNGLGAAWPRPQIEASRMAVDSSVSRATSHGPLAINLAAFSLPTRQGVHWPHDSSSKNFIKLSATAYMSSLSDRMT